MGTIQSGVGINTGVNITQLVDALINAQRGTILRLQSRSKSFENTQSGFAALSAGLLSLSTNGSTLSSTNSFEKRSVTVADKTALSVIANKDAAFGTYSFQGVKKAVAQEVTSQGFASDTQTLGTGSITIAHGGRVDQRTNLDILNSGNGVERGSIRVTDRSGASAVIDLKNAYTLDDVLTAINSNSSISVQATVTGNHLVLTDKIGQTASALSVAEVNGGATAAGLGILGSAGSTTLTGTDVYNVTGHFQLSKLNDGVGIRIKPAVDTLRIKLTDPAQSQVDVSLEGALTLTDVVDKINNDSDNAGKVSASIVNSRLVLTDLTGGGGPDPLTVENLNDNSVVRELGLDATAAGATLTGKRLSGTLNSVLLRNLKGGAGITQLGQLNLTDRTGTSATLNLSSAETLDDVLTAINNATSAGMVKLQLSATLNASGNGITITDKSGSTASSLIIADAGGATLAQDLGIAVNAAQNSVSSGSLSHQYIGLNTGLEKLAKNGKFTVGSFSVVDSNGVNYTVAMTSSTKTVGDLIDKINTATGGQVTAKLNTTGDGLELVDQAGGGSALQVNELNGTTASELKLLGTGTLGGDGKYHLSAREATVVSVEADDQLLDVVTSLNNAGGNVLATMFNTGSTLAPYKLSIRSRTAGTDGQFVIDQSGLNASFTTSVKADDTVLRVGGDGPAGFLLSSSGNRFVNVLPGMTVEVLKSTSAPVETTVSVDNSTATNAVTGFVSNYNKLLDTIATLTKFNSTTGERGLLQGNPVIQRITQRMSTLITRQTGTASDPIRSLSNLGVKVGGGGKLELDLEKLNDQLAEDPAAVTDFFTRANNGFGKAVTDMVSSYTDSFEGSLTKATESLQDNIDFIATRVTALEAILVKRKANLTRKFIRMDNIVGNYTAAQQSLSKIVSVTGNNDS